MHLARLAYWRLLFISVYLCHSFIKAEYNPLHPPTTETFDPGEANPDGFVYCLGNPQVQMPTFPNFNPNEKDLQQLCVKPQYNGGLRYQHAGAYCLTSNFVVFDNSSGAKTHPALANPRMWLQCALRCFCEGQQWEQSINAAPHQEASDEDDAEYLIKADLVDDFFMNKAAGWAPRHQEFFSMNLHTVTEVAARHQQLRQHPQHDSAEDLFKSMQASDVGEVKTSLDPPNHLVSCDGVMPSFKLPKIFTRTQRLYYSPLRALCASVIDGGSE